MKSLFISLTIVAATLLSACTEPQIIIVQCNDHAEEGAPPGDQPPAIEFFMHATIDGQLWIALVDSTPLTPGGEIVALDANHTSQITLRLPKKPVIGKVYPLTFPGQFGESSAFYTPNPSGARPPAYYGSTAGSVTIQGINWYSRIIGGTFNFTGTNAQTGEQITISDGVFKLSMP